MTQKFISLESSIPDNCSIDIMQALGEYLERINEVLNDAAPEELEAAVRRLYEFSLDSARRVDPELPGKLLEEQLERVAGSSISSIRSEPGDGGRRQFTITVPKVEAAAAIAETQETIGDDTSEPTTLDTDNISVATSGSHQRLQPLHEALSGVRVTFGHATRGGADFVIVSPKTAKDIEKDMKGIFSREGVYRLHELIEQHNSELRYPDGPETAIRAEKAATAKDTPREVKPLLRAFATFKRADTMQKQELRSLKTHLGMLAFLQEYDKLNEMMDEKSPSYNERLKQSLEMSRGRNCKSVVMDYLVILTKEDRRRVKHNLVEARALDKMTYAFGGKGVLCLIHSSMPSRLRNWGVHVMEKAWPLIMERVPRAKEICKLLEKRILIPIERGRLIETDLPARWGKNVTVYMHLKYFLTKRPASSQEPSRESTADCSDQQSMVASADGGSWDSVDQDVEMM